MRIYEMQGAIYHGLRDLEWRRYLCAMWIIGRELETSYQHGMSDRERALIGATLDAVRATSTVGAVTPETASSAGELAVGWEELMDEPENETAWQYQAWYVFSDLTAELSGASNHYDGAEMVDMALVHWWRLRIATGRHPIRINDPDEEAADDSPVAQLLSRVLGVVRRSRRCQSQAGIRCRSVCRSSASNVPVLLLDA